MTSEFLKQRIGLGILTALAAVAVLNSCNQGSRSATRQDAVAGDSVTIEIIQAPPEQRNDTPSFYVDLPHGFKYNNAQLTNGDVADFTEISLDSEEDLMAFVEKAQEDIRAVGFHWPAHDMAIYVTVMRYRTAPGGELTPQGMFYDEYFLSNPEMLLTYQVLHEEREVSFGGYSGKLYYTSPDLEQLETLTSEATGSATEDSIGFNVEDMRITEGVSLFLKGETHVIMVQTHIYDEGESMPEMMDLVVDIAKSVRIKEANANDG